jgi:hypothetical protein
MLEREEIIEMLQKITMDCEELLLPGADICPIHNTKLEDFTKKDTETGFIWSGWCGGCNQDVVTLSTLD